MSELKIKGQIVKFLPVESGTSKAGKEWKKQNYLVQNFEGYEGAEQIFCFEVFGADKVEKLTKYNKDGDDVVVHFNIQTNEWNGKYYTSLQSWKIEKAASDVQIKIDDQPKQEPENEVIYDSRQSDDDNDDLPF